MHSLPLFIAAVITIAALASPACAEAPPPIRVMSFNIRYGTANDGENHWDKRKDFVIETIKAFDPDLLGTQETLGFQRDFLAGKLDGYGMVGVGRDDGKDRGEMMAVYYRKARFEKLEAGHFWLSESPETVGSKSWDSSLPRMVTWLKLRDRKSPDAPPVYFFNTHFDHRGEEARLESAKLIRRRIAALPDRAPVILTGDFNAGEGSAPYKALFDNDAADGDTPSPVRDAYRVKHPRRADEEGTFSGFKADQRGGARIDWLACSAHWQVIEAGIDRTAKDGRTPSDHFPVTAVLRVKGG